MGKRAGKYGGFLLACYEPENEEYQSICKIGTGFTDEDLATHAAFFKDKVMEKPDGGGEVGSAGLRSGCMGSREEKHPTLPGSLHQEEERCCGGGDQSAGLRFCL